jgi:hypothetical protein
MNIMTNALSSAGNRIILWMRSANGALIVILISLILAMIAFMFHNPFIRVSSDIQFGILSLIPMEYGLALILSFILMVVNVTNKKRYYFFISMIFFILLFINVESFFLHNPVGGTDSYGHYLKGFYLEDRLNDLFSFDLATYPGGYFGSFIISKIAMELLGLNLTATVPLLTIFKMVMPFWFFACMYFLLTKLMPITKARIITILMIMSIPYFQFHYSPQAFGLIILPLLIYSIIIPTNNAPKNFLLQILLFSFLMVTHGPTTIYIALAYAFTVFMHYGLKSTRQNRACLNVSMPIAVYFLIGMSIFNPMVFHLFYSTFGNLGIQATINYSSTISEIGIFNLGIRQVGFLGIERLGGNYALAEFIRLYVLGIFTLIALFGTFKMFKKKEFTGLNIFIIGGFLATGLFTIGNILYPSLNLGDRSFLYLGFGGVFMSIYLLPEDFENRLKEIWKLNKMKFMPMLVILIFLSPIMGSLAYHYNQPFYYQLPQNEYRQLFIINHSNSAFIYSYWDNSGLITNKMEQEGYVPGEFIYFSLIDFNPTSPTIDQGTFIVVADSTEFMYKWDEKADEYNAIILYCNENMNQVYSSPGNSVWFV